MAAIESASAAHPGRDGQTDAAPHPAAPRKPAKARVIQKAKWISVRNSAPYSMNGKYRLPKTIASSAVRRPYAAAPSSPSASGNRQLMIS